MQKGHFVTNFHAKESCSFLQPYFACGTWSRWWLEPSLLSILFKNQTTWAREGEDTIPALVITCLLTERLWKISCSWLREVPTFWRSPLRDWKKKTMPKKNVSVDWVVSPSIFHACYGKERDQIPREPRLTPNSAVSLSTLRDIIKLNGLKLRYILTDLALKRYWI